MAIRHAALAGALALPLSLPACSLGPDFVRPDAPAPATLIRLLPDGIAGPVASAPTQASVRADWWAVFGDPMLTRLVEQVADANPDVQIASERLAQSRAQLGVTAAAGLPSVNANGSYTRERLSQKGVASLLGGSGGATSANGLGGRQDGVPTQTKLPAFDLFQQGFDASWELDFFGRIRRQTEGARAALDAAEEARRDMLVSMQAELARDYVQLRGTQAALAVTRASLRSARESLALTEQRQAGGLSSKFDVANAQAQVARTGSALPQLEQQAAQGINAIALLLGQSPGALAAELGATRPAPPVPPTVPVGLPSELARRRPDIRQAEAQLHQATAAIGAAEADFYPRITLSGSVGVQALQLKNLYSWGAVDAAGGPGVTIPIFQGGRLRATLELRKAQQREAALAYQKTVLRAFHEVDDALTAFAAEQARRTQLMDAVAAGRAAVALARDQYRSGITAFLPVLDAERTRLSAEQDLANSDATASANLVQLYKALGGGWQPSYPLDESTGQLTQR